MRVCEFFPFPRSSFLGLVLPLIPGSSSALGSFLCWN